MSLDDDIHDRERCIEELKDKKWPWLAENIRKSKGEAHKSFAGAKFAAEIKTALDEQYCRTLDCILDAAKRAGH